jgi:hypothetical protein
MKAKIPPHATISRQTRKCGRDCPRCPHGPYVYAYWRDGAGRLRSGYIGTETAYGELRASWRARSPRSAKARALRKGKTA